MPGSQVSAPAICPREILPAGIVPGMALHPGFSASQPKQHWRGVMKWVRCESRLEILAGFTAPVLQRHVFETGVVILGRDVQR